MCSEIWSLWAESREPSCDEESRQLGPQSRRSSEPADWKAAGSSGQQRIWPKMDIWVSAEGKFTANTEKCLCREDMNNHISENVQKWTILIITRH